MPGVVRLYDIQDNVLSVAHYESKEKMKELLLGWEDNFPEACYYNVTPEVKLEKEPKPPKIPREKPKPPIQRPKAEYTNIKIYKYDE